MGGLWAAMEQNANTINENITAVRNDIAALQQQITAVQTQVSGDAPPVTAGVRAELVHVHFELNRAIEKAVWMRGLIFFGIVLVLCMQVAITAIMYIALGVMWHKAVDGPAQEALPNDTVFCMHVPKTVNGTVVWDGIISMNMAALMAMGIVTP